MSAGTRPCPAGYRLQPYERPKRILSRPANSSASEITTTTATETASARNTFSSSRIGDPRTTDDNGPAGRVRWRGLDDALPAQRSPAKPANRVLHSVTRNYGNTGGDDDTVGPMKSVDRNLSVEWKSTLEIITGRLIEPRLGGGVGTGGGRHSG